MKNLLKHNIPEIEDKDKIECHFENFIDKEKNKAISELIDEEQLDDNITKGIIAEYEFSGKMRNDIIKNSFTEHLGLKEKRSKLQRD